MKSHLAIVCGAFLVSTVSLPLRSASDEPVFRVGHGVTAPRPLNRPAPEYSEEARRAGLQGKCILSVVVNSEGKAQDIQVARSLGMGLDEKAMEAVRQWTFEPARKDGKPVAVRIQVATTFRIGTGLGKMPPDLRKRLESGRKAAEEHARKHVYRVEANTTDSLCRPTREDDQGNRVSIPVITPERGGYQLQSITFTGNKTLTNGAALRSLFPIRDGEPFDATKVADGLQQLKKAYGSQGFVSFKASVDPEIDDSRRSIALRITCDEGRQFYVQQINIVGLDENAFQELRKTLYVTPGQLYNERLAYAWLEKNSRLLSTNPSVRDRMKLDINENEGQLVMTYDFTRCGS